MSVQCEVRYERLSIFKRADRSCYSVSFKDVNGKYLRPVSTGKKTEKEAMKVAFMWLRDGIPQKETALKVSDLSLTDIDAFINYMGDMDLSASRKNVVIKAGTKPIRWVFSKGMIDKDPTRGHIMFSGDEGRREILTPTVAAAAFRAVWNDDRVKLANMLAAVTGIWNKTDGMKPTKNNEPILMFNLFVLLLQKVAAFFAQFSLFASRALNAVKHSPTSKTFNCYKTTFP